ncbi:hypothetical protein DFH06DRAFT_1288650 [Mycena polygramma]|nr:hypothetical protein DFH06DRAFT_1288650 [Mycena polygramma]
MVSAFEDAGDCDHALLSCAVLSRAFASPVQRKLFSTVHLRGIGDQDRFIEVLSSSRHIGGFVRTFRAEYNVICFSSRLMVEILSALPRLECICLKAESYGDPHRIFNASPEFFDACRRACSLPTVRRIELRCHIFANAMELEALLASSTSLRELLLEEISFKKKHVVRVPSSRSISLDSLEISRMEDDGPVRCMLEAFTTIDIKHLRYLRLAHSALDTILEANAGSLQEVEIKYESGLDYDDPPVAMFAGQSTLQFIRLDAWYADAFGAIIASFGGLDDLRRLTVRVRDQSCWRFEDEGDWKSIDRALDATQDLRNLEEVQILVRPNRWGEVVKLQYRFPLLAQRGLLHLVHVSFEEQYQYLK